MINETILPSIPDSATHISWDPNALIKKGKICDIHYHDEIELLIVKSGRMSMTVDGEEYAASSGQVLYAGSCVPHFTTALTDDLNYAIVQIRIGFFGQDDARPLLSVIKSEGKDCTVIDDDEIIREIDNILSEYFGGRHAYDFMVKSSVYRIIGRLIRLGIVENPAMTADLSAVERLLPALNYVNENYAGPLTLEDVSELMGLNPSYFCRLFKSATGVTFTEYLNAVRVRKSGTLLHNTSKSITDVSNEVGFSTVTYYNRVFKKYMKCTPSIYRMIKYKNI